MVERRPQLQLEEGNWVIGIDLGTSNSVVSVWKENKISVIQNNVGSCTTPSVV